MVQVENLKVHARDASCVLRAACCVLRAAREQLNGELVILLA
jgi:hypothetical protein